MNYGKRRRGSSDYLRSCDYCGRLVLRSMMVKKDGYLACKDDARGKERLTLDKANAANMAPRRWKPAESRLSDRDNEIDVYQADEAVAFNDICLTGCFGADGVFRAGLAPYELIDITGNGPGAPLALASQATETARCAGWCIDYLYAILVENRRPATWLTNAKATLVRLGDWLLAHQFSVAGAGDWSTAATKTWFGGFPRTGVAGTTATVFAEDQGIALLGLLRAYQVAGNINYLLAARTAATCLRRLQCGGLRTSGALVANAQGGFWAPAAPSSSLVISRSVGVFATSAHGTDFYPGDLIALEAMNLLKALDGDSSYGDAGAVGEFAQGTLAMLSVAMGQFRSFWANDWIDSDGFVRQGLSAATPREFYRLSLSTAPATPSWNYKFTSTSQSFYVTSRDRAIAIRSLNAYEGYSGQVAEVLNWLNGVAANSSFTLDSDPSPVRRYQTTFGAFDPQVAPPAEIDVTSSATVGAFYYAPVSGGASADMSIYNPGPVYDLAAAGLISGVQPSSPAAKKVKAILAPRVQRRYLPRGNAALGAPDANAGGAAQPVIKPPTNDMVFWFKSDAGVVMNGSNQVSNWLDQTPNQNDVAPVDSFGTLAPVGQWPVFTPNAINGLPALQFTAASSQKLQHNYIGGTTNKPTPDGSPITCLALVKATAADMGIVCTLRENNNDLEMGIRRGFGNEYMLSSAQDHSGKVVSGQSIDRTGQILALVWQFFGVPNASMTINGVAQKLTDVNGNEPLLPYSGEVGFAIGTIPAVFAGFLSAYVAEVMLYGDTNPATVAQASNYLMQRAGLSPLPTATEFEPNEIFDAPIMRGKAGLSTQVGFKEQAEGGTMYALKNILAAAQAGAVYRQAPRIWPLPDDGRST